MEPKYENKFTRTFDVERELYKYMHLQSPSSIACFVILGIVAVVNLVMCIIAGFAYVNMAVFIMCVIVIFVMFFRYYSSLKTAEKRLREDTRGATDIEITAILDGEDLISKSSDRDKETVVPYSNFRKIFATKSFYMIQTDAKLVYVFKKGCFTIGSEADFIPYVNRILEHNKRKSR